MKAFSNVIGYLTALSLAIYAVFKFCYIEGAWLLMIISGIFLSIYFLVMIPQKLSETSGGKVLHTHIAAAICASILTLAVLATFQQWSISGILFLVGFSCTCLIFIPLMFLQESKKTTGASRFPNTVGAIGLEALTLGIYFKMQHWSGADILFVVGLALLLLIYFPVYMWDTSISDERKSTYLHDASFVIIIGLLFFLFVFGTVMRWKVTMNYLTA